MNGIIELIHVYGEDKIKSIIYRVLNHNFIQLYTSKTILFEKIRMKCYFDVEFQKRFTYSVNKFILYEKDQDQDINECYYEIENILQEEEFYNEKTQNHNKEIIQYHKEWKIQYEKEKKEKHELFLNPFRLEFMVKKNI